MLKRLLAVCLVLLSSRAVAQYAPEDLYYPYAEPEVEGLPDVEVDTLPLYHIIYFDQSLYEETTRYALPRVTIRHRGESFHSERAYVAGVGVDYRHFALLRGVGVEEHYAVGASIGETAPGSTGGVRSFRLVAQQRDNPYNASVRLTDRNYLVSGRVQMQHRAGKWFLSSLLDARGGNDMRIKGVFTNGLSAALSASRSLRNGADLAFFVGLPLSERGLRSAVTEEAMTLVDDRYYNSSWGMQGGKERNARVRREMIPLVVANLRHQLSEQTRLELALGGEYGIRRQSALNWFDARTPLPDNYRYMPSYTGDRETEEAWRQGDSRYTQIDWEELINQNRLADGEAVYALEERVSRPLKLSASVDFHTQIEGWMLRYGLRANYRNTRYYKEMDDLLGADFLTDIDQYLIDDDTYGNRLQNDLRNPSRRIGEGDRFGYDYALCATEAAAYLGASWASHRLRLELIGELGYSTLSREGYYEKELFPGALSYGRSKRIVLNPYRLKANARWAFSPTQALEVSLAAGADQPAEEHLFLQPLYNNRAVDNPTEERFYGAQIHYNEQGYKLNFQLTAFATLRLDGIETRRYYDDLAATYADMTTSGLGVRALGLEGAVAWRVSPRWQLSAAASLGDYRYVRDARVTVLSDVDNSPIDRDAVSHLDGCRVGGAPALTATFGVRYYGPRGWGARLSSGYAGRRYVDLEPLRRTDRVARQNGTTPEAFAAFTAQERLDDAFTVDCSLFKSFYFNDESSLLVMLHLNNLTDRANCSYGYESLRSQWVGEDTGAMRMPQATRYLYTTPRTVALQVSYRF